MSDDWWPTFEAPAGGTPPPGAQLLSQAQSDALSGRILLIGITERGDEGERHFQTYGRVVEIDPVRGVSIACKGVHSGRTFTIPPDARAFGPAEPGSYRLRSTGETVIDPDFLATFDIGRRAPSQSSQADLL